MGERLQVDKAVTLSSKVGVVVDEVLSFLSGTEAGVHPQSAGPSQVAIH